jgi:4'-phosphopantetheinyl transferase
MQQLLALDPSTLPFDELILPRDEVHIWLVRLNSTSQMHRWERLLSSEERDRAGRFRFLKDRNRFILARGSLRSLLGSYLRCKPENVRFAYGALGKPAVDGQSGALGLRFNLSHSKDLLLIAFARRREVGVDIEWIRAGADHENIAEYLFSPREVASLRSLPLTLQRESFFNSWTCKEAYAKALGTGLSERLVQFEVSLLRREPAPPLNPGSASRWSIYTLAPPLGYAAALVVEGYDWRLKSCP